MFYLKLFDLQKMQCTFRRFFYSTKKKIADFQSQNQKIRFFLLLSTSPKLPMTRLLVDIDVILPHVAGNCYLIFYDFLLISGNAV